MDTLVARRTWRTLEPIHSMIYFVPEGPTAYRALGLDGQWPGYFASRSAAMGSPSAELVIATFYNFNPTSIRAVIPDAWRIASHDDVIDARFMVADTALRRLLGEAIDSPEMREAAELARYAALAACDRVEGRPLFAGHAALKWPTDPHMVLWHAQTLLREYRGDGHIAALVSDGISGIEALLMHGGTGVIEPEVLRQTRSWDDESWTAASDRLIERGLLDPDGTLSVLGNERRQWLEDRTDELAMLPYEAIGEDACDRLRLLCRPFSRAIVDGGGLPV